MEFIYKFFVYGASIFAILYSTGEGYGYRSVYNEIATFYLFITLICLVVASLTLFSTSENIKKISNISLWTWSLLGVNVLMILTPIDIDSGLRNILLFIFCTLFSIFHLHLLEKNLHKF